MKKNLTILFVFTLLIVSSLSFSLPVKAASRTIVVPDDYSTIASAIGNATDGDTILIRSGTYLEHSLSINKTLSLIGENVKNTIIRDIDKPQPYFTSPLMAGPTAITVETQADDVVITGLTIETNNVGADHTFVGFSIASYGIRTQIFNNYLPEGINFPQFGSGLSGSYELVTGNSIGQIADNFAIISNAPYSYIVNNSIIGGVKLVDPSGKGYLNNVIYANNISTTIDDYDWSAWGINIYMSRGNLIAKNNITNCYAGIVSDLSSYNTIIGNSITNSYIGLATIQGGGENNFSGNSVVHGSFSAAVAGYSNYFYENNFIDNLNELADPNSLRGPNNDRVIYWYKGNHGNYWSHYNGSDANNDGIGDTHYTIDANNSDPFPLMAPFEATSVSLPDWTNIMNPVILPSTFPTPKSTQSPSTTPSLSPTISPTPTLSPTPSTSIPEFSSLAIPLLLTIIVAVGLLVYFKKRKREVKS